MPFRWLATMGFLGLWILSGNVHLGRAATTAVDRAPRDQDASRTSSRRPNFLDRRGPRFPVRQLGRDLYGDLVAESDHFRVVFEQKPEFMERVARAAEQVRLTEYQKWSGSAAEEWDGKCAVYLYANHALYSKKTKQDGAGAHFSPRMEGGMVYRRSVHLPCDVAGLFEDVLPHEVTHSVIASVLNGRAPRWADEGMAVLAESPASLKKWHQRLAKSHEQNDLFGPDVLMRTEEPEHIRSAEYYAQSMSLVEFFVAAKGRREFIRFLRDSDRVGYEAALKKHYGITSFAELNRRWLAFAFTTRAQPAVAAQPGRS